MAKEIIKIMNKIAKIFFLIFVALVLSIQITTVLQMQHRSEKDFPLEVIIKEPVKVRDEYALVETKRFIQPIKVYQYKGEMLFWAHNSAIDVLKPWVLMYEGRAEQYQNNLRYFFFLTISAFLGMCWFVYGIAGIMKKEYSEGQTFINATTGIIMLDLLLAGIVLVQVVLIMY